MNTIHTLFKFRAINKYLIEPLVNPSLYFAKPNTLNDPFDCLLNLKGLLERATLSTTGDRKEFLLEMLRNQKFEAYWQKEFDDIGMGSFSIKIN